VVNGNIRIEGKRIRLPKIGMVRIKVHREIPEDWKMKSVTVSKEPSGKYYASLLFEVPERESQAEGKREEKRCLGIDYAMDGLAVFSDGSRAAYPKYYRRAEERLAREQRKLSHCEKGSRNYARQKRKVAVCHEKVRNQRKDFLHKLSRDLADRYDVEEKDAQPRANDRVTNTFRQKMRDAVKDYSEVKQKAESIRLSDAKAEYAMLPVWMMSTSYGGKIYPLAVNGQSGKMIGSLPIDQGKYYKYFAIAAAICFAIISAIVFFLGSRGFSAKGEIAAAVIALIVGFIYAGHLKGTMNTITKKRSAASYLKDKSLKMGTPSDRFIYTKTEKTEKSKAKESAKEAPKAGQKKK
jgi:hypothetical protein